MFEARIKKYWNDFLFEYEEIKKESIEDILEYIYKFHERSCHPGISKFLCNGANEEIGGHGYVQASCSLREKVGFRGSVYLEEIRYVTDNYERIIVFQKNKYISPKTSQIFKDFAAMKKNNKPNYGEF